MAGEKSESVSPESLRQRALVRLTGNSDPHDPRANASAALAVLHELASSPATAADSLKLLHELQVHQVELDRKIREKIPMVTPKLRVMIRITAWISRCSVR